MFDNYNYLPVKKTKTNGFTVRMTDQEHKAVLAVTHMEGSCRAVTTTELVLEGLKAYAERHQIDLSDDAVNEYLESHGIIQPRRS